MWLLIRAFSDDKETSWKNGDIVEVRDDDFVEKNGWGNVEGLPKFYRVHVDGVNSHSMKFLEKADKTRNRVRLYQLSIDSLQTDDKTTLQQDGILNLTRTKFINSIKDNNNQPVGIE